MRQRCSCAGIMPLVSTREAEVLLVAVMQASRPTLVSWLMYEAELCSCVQVCRRHAPVLVAHEVEVLLIAGRCASITPRPGLDRRMRQRCS